MLGGSIFIIDRTTLTITDTIVTSSLVGSQHFTVDVILIPVGTKVYVVNSKNALISSIGVYNADFSIHLGEIALSGAAHWSFAAYWQTGFYDETSTHLYIGDVGSSQRYVIDTTTDTVIDTQTLGNKGGKTNVVCSWTTNPVTDELMFLFTAVNNSADASPIKRAYIEDRTTHQYITMFESQQYSALYHIAGTNTVMGVNPGTPFWNGDPAYNTDGSITFLSNSLSGTNTGKEIITKLQEVDANNGNTPTGNTKDNLVGDPDYISPINPSTNCLVESTSACPTDLVTTFTGTTLEYELSLIASVHNNPNIAKVQIYAYNTNTASVEGLPHEFSAPFLNGYFSGQFIGLGGTNYTIQVRYLDSTGATLQTC